MRKLVLGLIAVLASAGHAAAADTKLADYFPPPESRGGWRTLLPDSGEPDAAAKAKIRETGGVDWDKLRAAWEHNASSAGGTGLLVIRNGYIVGEWYKDADRATRFNIYSSSKSYTSTAFGLILRDFGNETPAGGKSLTLDTRVCNEEWMPEALPVPDPRKADITVRHLLNMTAGLSEENPPMDKPFEWSLGHVEGSPMAKLKNEPGEAFHYSNAGVSHLVLVFNRAAKEDVEPFLQKRLFEPIGLEEENWLKIGGKDGAIGPYTQGYSGLHTNPRQHARYCYLALHKGEWAGKRIVPETYYDFAWTGTKANPGYGGQWWTAPKAEGVPSDLVRTLGKDHNDGFVVPSLDLVFVRLGNGTSFPKDFEIDLVKIVLAAVLR